MSLSAEDVKSHSVAILLCELCVGFYKLKWNLGTGGGISIQEPGSSLIFLSPSGIHKERMLPTDLFVYDCNRRRYIYVPAEHRRPSASSVLFLWLHEHHGAGAVIHTHSMYSNLATQDKQRHKELENGQRHQGLDGGTEVWSTADQEYIKGIPRWTTGKMMNNDDDLNVPIIGNRSTEDELLPDLTQAIALQPDTTCVLVRKHGAYHFGKDIWKCKAQTECLEYLFELEWHASGRGSHT